MKKPITKLIRLLLALASISFVLLFLSSCNETPPEPVQYNYKYLHLSHTLSDVNPKVDSLVARIDFKQFDYLWLGGDLAENSSKDSSSIMYLDTVFDLQSHNTFWSAGNHDYVHSDLIRDITSRETFYFVKKNGLMIVVIDTQLDQCHIGGQQKSMLESALKNIAGSTHLILLHHKLIWMYNDEVLEMQIDSVSNAPVGDCIFCIYPNNFNQEIYPMLVEIRSQGIEVICIGGDIGKKTSEFEYVTPEGIHFLASGINANEAGNKALLFEHDRETDHLSWKYVLLTDLQQQYP